MKQIKTDDAKLKCICIVVAVTVVVVGNNEICTDNFFFFCFLRLAGKLVLPWLTLLAISMDNE